MRAKINRDKSFGLLSDPWEFVALPGSLAVLTITSSFFEWFELGHQLKNK